MPIGRFSTNAAGERTIRSSANEATEATRSWLTSRKLDITAPGNGARYPFSYCANAKEEASFPRKSLIMRAEEAEFVNMSPAIFWFRQDLRLADNPGLAQAAQSGRPVVCLYALDDETPGHWRLGGASRWWLHQSLQLLSSDLESIGGTLILRRGGAAVEILAREIGAASVTWNRCYEPAITARDAKVKTRLGENGVDVASFNASLLFEPWIPKTSSGGRFKMFTPFWRALQSLPEPARPIPPPTSLARFAGALASERLEDWNLTPSTPDWAGGLRAAWTPGERGAQARLGDLLDKLGSYAADRDRPDIDATSRLSPHLHFGEISPRQIWHAVRAREPGADKFLSEIAWREFSYHLLFHNPAMPDAPLDAKFAAFPWRDDAAAFAAWSRGRTGIPIVDAGMRQLWTSGWMHNRVRMIAASFLVKHLGIDWRRGEAWFWDTLVDADLANNAASWQWAAGSGADAAPFFRIFNPVLQGEKFDPEGAYVRRFVPELAGVPTAFIHKPWAAPGGAPRGYPVPIVDLKDGRERALAAFRSLAAP